MVDREKVIKGLERFKADFKPFCGNGSDWARVDDAINQLKKQPEIIRCKDCKRYYANGGSCDQILSNWFCADGKRR